MKLNILITITFIFSAYASVLAQTETCDLCEYLNFACSGWLCDFPDTLTVYQMSDTIPNHLDISTVRKEENGSYSMRNWERNSHWPRS